jgi:acyl-CoA thioesterase
VSGKSKEFELLHELIGNQPFLRWIGIELIDAGPGWARERLPIRPEFLQPTVVHGGVTYALADTLAAHAVLTLTYPQEWITTVEQKINFLRTASEGDLLGHSRVIHMGKRIAYCEVELTNDGGELVAKSTATLMRIPPYFTSGGGG